MEYAYLVAGWAIYLTLHSVLASDSIKRKFPSNGFRKFYILMSLAGLIAIMYYGASIESPKFFVVKGPLKYISFILTAFGVMTIQSAFSQYNFMAFIGAIDEKKELKTEGILQHVRHPVIAGVILIFLAFFFFLPNLPTLVSCLCVFVYVPIGIWLEEKKLIATYGDQYIEYKKKVPAIVPFM